MTIHLGDVPASSTLYIPFSTYAGSTGASATLTGLAVTDIEIYKNGSVTQRASDAGYALLDTDGIDFDAITGIHGFSVDLSDNTDAGFYSVGGFYWVVVSSVTVDSQTVNFIAATFRIIAAEAIAGKPKVDVDGFGGTAGTFSGGRPEVNTSHIAGSAVSTSTAQIGVNVVNFGGAAGTFASGRPEVNASHWAGAATATNDVALATAPSNFASLAIDAGGIVSADVQEINGDATAADNLAKTTAVIGRGTVTTGASTTSIPTSAFSPSGAASDQFKGRIITFDADTATAALRGQATDITASSNSATPTFTVTALTSTPASGDTFSVT